MAQIPAFDEKARLNDSLTSQKEITGAYNTFANECVNTELMGMFINILTEEHTIQHDLFEELQSRGWYTTSSVDQQKIQKAADKFSKDM